MQVTYALGTVSKLVYLTIMYRKVKNIDYHKATAAVQAATLGGKFAAGYIGQVNTPIYNI